MSDGSLEVLRGTLDLLILKVLSQSPAHGYALTTRLRRLTDDALQVEEGSMYPALYRMARKGWIESEWCLTEKNQRAKIHRLTEAGREHLEKEERYWTRFSEAVGKVMRSTTELSERGAET